jgi:HPt (histidine-containing phosphotransfer) domain-containing protein
MDEAFDRYALLAVAGGDLNLLKELIEIFEPEYRRFFTQLQRAIVEKDASGLRASAHAIKSLAGNFYARRAYAVAWQLEEMGRQADLGQAKEVSARLDSEAQALKMALEQFVQQAECSAKSAGA